MSAIGRNKELELDVLGQYYASIINSKQSGVFALSVYLIELVQPKILQQAADDMMRRLPFLNGRLKYGFFHYKYEVIEALAKIKPESNEPLFGDYYSKGDRHMIGIVYGEKHFTVKTTHSICDGRGLSKFTAALIVRYFELMGINVEKGEDIIDCNGKFTAEEAEDAYKRYAAEPQGEVKENTPKITKAYIIKIKKSSPQHIRTESFDTSKLKATAKAYGVTISEYILAHIFTATARMRDKERGKGQIIGSIPIDCRSFFPSKTLRSFVDAAKIIMPENIEFSDMASQIKAQFKSITKQSVQKQIYEHQSIYDATRFVPRALKALFMKMMARSDAAETTTGLSNLGLIRLPAEIECRIERMEFPIALEQENSQFFSCVTIGNTLSLTATYRKEGQEIVEKVMDRLKRG